MSQIFFVAPQQQLTGADLLATIKDIGQQLRRNITVTQAAKACGYGSDVHAFLNELQTAKGIA
jgi:hypothetical protein